MHKASEVVLELDGFLRDQIRYWGIILYMYVIHIETVVAVINVHTCMQKLSTKFVLKKTQKS